MRAPHGLVPFVCLLVVWLCTAASAQGGLAYTVQVAALSDPESAIGQSGALLRDGFPAYVVRAEGAAGTVFRVRVGAFGDRASADRYARAMGERAGGTPRPALAEAIPAGILPVAPTAVTRIPTGVRAVLLPWGDGDTLALRTGPADDEGQYEILGGDGAFEAWWAEPTPSGREEIVRLPLDDEAGATDAPEVREALFRQRLRLVAERSGQAEEDLAGAVRGEPGGRYLVAWRSVGGEEAVHGLLAAEADPSARDEEAWLGRVPPPPTEPLSILQLGGAAAAEARPDEDGAAPVDADEDEDGDDAPAEEAEPADPSVAEGEEAAPADPPVAVDEPTPTEAGAAEDEPTPSDDAVADEGADGAAPVGVVDGEGWSAETDGRWTVLTVGDVSWRALVGAPREGLLDLLVLEVEDGLEIVRLVPR